MKRLLLGSMLALSGTADASFHLMKVVEVFPGTTLAPNAQYVVIQMYFGGQNSLAGHKITVYDHAGTLLSNGTSTFSGVVGMGNNQDRILIATPQAATLFNITADLEMTAAAIPAAGGKVCFDAIPIDCVAWGTFSGPSNSTVGAVAPVLNPMSAPIFGSGGLVPGKSATRRLNIAGSPTALDASDDTDSSANDFVFQVPTPRNSANQAGTIPPSTCGNAAIEGLELCDDGNTNGGDACSAMCDQLFDDVFENSFE